MDFWGLIGTVDSWLIWLSIDTCAWCTGATDIILIRIYLVSEWPLESYLQSWNCLLLKVYSNIWFSKYRIWLLLSTLGLHYTNFNRHYNVFGLHYIRKKGATLDLRCGTDFNIKKNLVSLRSKVYIKWLFL